MDRAMRAIEVLGNASTRAPGAEGRRRRCTGPGAAAVLAALILAGCSAPRASRDALLAAEAASSAQDWPRAAELWSDLLFAADGRDKRASHEAARALFLGGDPASACGMLRQALAHFPEDPDLLELFGRIQRDCGFRRAAEDCYARVVRFDPDRVLALRALAELRMELGLEQSAVAPLQRVIELTGGDARTFALLGDAQRVAGDPKAALRSYETAMARGDLPLSTLIEASGLTLERAVREADPRAIQRALGWLELAVRRDPQSTRAHFLLALVNEELHHAEPAALHYRRAIETDPACIEALRNLAALYARMGDEGGTSEMVARALELEGDPQRRAALMNLLADGIR